ncbi:MAG: PD-(D/E)XK nuclease family protein, partial [Verrucomicrobiota bacterium]|nr:PD-(D/E)XK nuclease family protein [Verrucomicrobiota bacterium]
IIAAAEGDAAEASPTAIRSRSDSPATLYGRWWHSLFEAVAWHEGIEDAERLFQERQPQSPDPARSAAGWKLVGKLFGQPILQRFILSDSAHAHAEFPFSWCINRSAVLEGVIDLLVIDVAAGRCLLLDWKTNRVAKRDVETLRMHYRPQIAAYAKAVGAITRLEVEAGLYSTATGELLMFSAAELETEWTRLARLPDEQMRMAVAPDDSPARI